MSLKVNEQHAAYRPDIDGLRAFAVLSVIGFHAYPEWLAAGFIGVDIFFVISGYLISGIIYSNIKNDDFSILEFYKRRIRRIFPALILVLTSSLAAGWFFLSAHEYKQLGKHVAAGAGFVSNLVFWNEAGYFDVQSDLKPLLHLWSLGIEEQFYILWPLLLWGGWKWGLSLFGIGVIALLWSFGTNLNSIHEDSIATFYSPQTRFWELISGAILAWIFIDQTDPIGKLAKFSPLSRWQKKGALILANLMSVTGLAILIYSLYRIDAKVAFPGIWATLPVLGTLFIIAGGRQALINSKLLSNKFLIKIGLISFPLYLWHWPLLSFARLVDGEKLSEHMTALVLAISFALAWLTYVFFERPVRAAKSFYPTIFLLLLVMIGFAGGYVYQHDGLKLRPYNVNLDSFSERFKWSSLTHRIQTEGEMCLPKPNEKYQGINTCEFGDIESKRVIVLYGDSHAEALTRVLSKRSLELGYRVIFANSGCSAIFGISSQPGENPKRYFDWCNKNFAELQRFIRDLKASTLIATRWTYQYFPMPGFVDVLPFDNGVGGIETDLQYRKNVAITASGATSIEEPEKRAATVELIKGLSKFSEHLYLAYPIPEIGWDIYQVNKKAHRSGKVIDELSFPRERYLERNKYILSLLEETVVTLPNIVPLRADQIFCGRIKEGRCVAQSEGKVYYYDDDHLSDDGASLLVDDFFDKLTRKSSVQK